MNIITNNLSNYACLISDNLKNKLLTKQNLVIMAVALAIFTLGVVYFRLMTRMVQQRSSLPSLQPTHSKNSSTAGVGVSLIQPKKFAIPTLKVTPAPKVTPTLKTVLTTKAGAPTLEERFASADLKLVEYARAFPKIDDQKRYGVRDKTKQKVCDVFKVNNFQDLETKLLSSSIEDFDDDIRSDAKKIILATAAFGAHQSSPQQLLGRFDVLTVPCRMDFDAQWNEKKSKHGFLVHHAAALNIGENRNAADFKDYAINGRLDEKKYIQDMGIIFRHILAEQVTSHVKHAVWFPLGMGAFLRKLPQRDSFYQDPKAMQALKQKLVKAFVDEASSILYSPAAASLQLHICLPYEENKDSETWQNYFAFFEAFQKAPDFLKERTQFHINIDATDLAQRLADQESTPDCVSLVNGANRNLIGNKWFADHARVAIDENLHRRSSRLAVFAALLNQRLKPLNSNPLDLTQRVSNLGGYNSLVDSTHFVR